MQTAPPPLPTCPACGSAVGDYGACSRCEAPEDWADQVDALDFVARRFEDWGKSGRIAGRQAQLFAELYARRRQQAADAKSSGAAYAADPNLRPRRECWSCKEPFAGKPSHCEECGAPLSAPAAKSLRFCRFLKRELEEHEGQGRLTIRQAHELINETGDRIDALKQRLERDRALAVTAVRPDRVASIARAPRRSFMEALLDPQSIQWLLASGGGLLVVGLVIWLSSLELFKEPSIVAAALGLGNAALVLGGWATIHYTRYRFAGRALTLLACLVMPLNLWFYHTHNLVTLEGHLWVAAVVCCVVYAASALVLRDPLFVYVLVGGITLTGLLLLGELQRFTEVYAPSALLVVLALVCLHAERAFPDTETDFSRRRFGMAFYWSAQGLLAAGLLLLLGAQLFGWLDEPVFRHMGFPQPLVATRAYLPWTLMLVLAGAYAYVYSDVVVRRIGVYIYLAAITLLWAMVQTLVMLDLPGEEAIVIATLALAALIINALQVTFEEKRDFLRTVPPLGMLLTALPVAFGVVLHFRATNAFLHEVWPFQFSWAHVGAMALVAVSCRVGAHLYRRSLPELSTTYFFLTAAATLVGAAELAWLLGLNRWETQAPVLMLIPIAYLVASSLYRGHTPEKPLLWVAHASTALMILCSVWATFQLGDRLVAPITGQTQNLLLALFCLEATIFYGLAAAMRKAGWNVYLATLMLCGAMWQGLQFFQVADEYYTLAFSLTGLALLVLYRFAVLESWEVTGLSRSAFQSANVLITLGFVSGVLLALSRVFMSEHELGRLVGEAGEWRSAVWAMIYLLGYLTAANLLAAALVQQPDWRRVFLVLTVVGAVLIAVMFHKMSLLGLWQKVEIVSVLLGAALLAAGHVGWYREDEERTDDTVSLALGFGSLLVVVPLGIATLVHRFGFEVSAVDELLLVFASVALLGSGIVCRLKSTTVIGSLTLVNYILMVIVYMHRFLHQQAIVGVYLTIGGGLLFGLGLALSVYRDRLLTLPEKIKRREGIFRVFGWR